VSIDFSEESLLDNSQNPFGVGRLIDTPPIVALPANAGPIAPTKSINTAVVIARIAVVLISNPPPLAHHSHPTIIPRGTALRHF